ncbi:non-structural maintenance of chromosomes element 1 homolog isoform X2 [Macaca nemestrina]
MQGSTRRMGVMTDVHRRFLQLLMTHGVLEEWDVKRLQRHCYKVHDRNATVDKLEDFINNINSVLESLYIEIKRGVTEDDGRPIYALVNLATTSISKMATDFAENELDLFRKALELIIDSETGFASSTNILNLVDQLKGKKMRKKEAEQVLQKFVQNKWLIEVLVPVCVEDALTSGSRFLTWWSDLWPEAAACGCSDSPLPVQEGLPPDWGRCSGCMMGDRTLAWEPGGLASVGGSTAHGVMGPVCPLQTPSSSVCKVMWPEMISEGPYCSWRQKCWEAPGMLLFGSGMGGGWKQWVLGFVPWGD